MTKTQHWLKDDPMVAPLMNLEPECEIERARRRPPYIGTERFRPANVPPLVPIAVVDTKTPLRVNQFSAWVCGVSLSLYGLCWLAAWMGWIPQQ
jgi:hypothetical protein